jgi:hypothetical protein
LHVAASNCIHLRATFQKDGIRDAEDHEHTSCTVGVDVSARITRGDLAAALPDAENDAGADDPILERAECTPDRSTDSTEILAD